MAENSVNLFKEAAMPSGASLKELVAKRNAMAADVEYIVTQLKAAIKAEQDRLDDMDTEIRNLMANAGLESVSVDNLDGTTTVLQVKPTQHANVEDWDAFYQWILATGNVHYLHKRVASTMVVDAFQRASFEAEAHAVDNPQQYIRNCLPSGVTVLETKKLVVSTGVARKARRVSAK